jgi:hypothetical protein
MRTNESREVIVETIVMDDVATKRKMGANGSLQVAEGLRSGEWPAEGDLVVRWFSVFLGSNKSGKGNNRGERLGKKRGNINVAEERKEKREKREKS